MGPIIFNTQPEPHTSLHYQTLEDDTQHMRGKEKKKILEMIPWRTLALVLSSLCLIIIVSINMHHLEVLNEVR